MLCAAAEKNQKNFVILFRISLISQIPSFQFVRIIKNDDTTKCVKIFLSLNLLLFYFFHNVYYRLSK